MASSPQRSLSPPPTKKARLPASDLGCGNGTSPEQDFDAVSQGMISQDDHGSSWFLPSSESDGATAAAGRLKSSSGESSHRPSTASSAGGSGQGIGGDSERDSGDSGFSEDGGATTPASGGEDESQDGLRPPATAASSSSFSMQQEPTSFASSHIFTFSAAAAASSCNNTSSSNAAATPIATPAATTSLFGDRDPATPDAREIELVPLDSGALDIHLPDHSNTAEAGDSHYQHTASRPQTDSRVTVQRPNDEGSAANDTNTSQEGTDNPDDDDDDDDDNVSTVSGLSDLSGADWKPAGAGPFSWVQHHMMKGTDPRHLLKDMIAADTVIPDHLDQLTLWKIILNMVSEPPRRKKLQHINTIEDVVHLIAISRKIIVLTGAGVSVSCGIPDFRSRDGVYARLAVDFPDLPDPQAMFDINYFRKDPRPFFKFAREIYPGQFKPSPCHSFIKSIEKHGKLLRNYTQNIDTLEQVAGIERAVQCHGSFATATCTVCKYKVQADDIKEDIFQQRIPYCPKCNNGSTEDLPASSAHPETSSSNSGELLASSSSSSLPAADSNNTNYSDSPLANGIRQIRGIMKPDIVFFGEGLGDEFHKSVAIDKHEADLLIMIGSSLKVRPVALIPSSISPEVPQILINREPLSHLTPDVELLGDCDGIINQICLKLGDGWEDPVHKPELFETQELEAAKPGEDIAQLLPSSKVVTESTETTADVPVDGHSVATDTCNDNLGHSEKIHDEPKPSTSTQPDLSQEERQERLMTALWKPRTSIATRLKESSYCFQAPSRYIFPGAEVYDKSCQIDESDSSSSDSSSSNGGDDSDDEGSGEEATATKAKAVVDGSIESNSSHSTHRVADNDGGTHVCEGETSSPVSQPDTHTQKC